MSPIASQAKIKRKREAAKIKRNAKRSKNEPATASDDEPLMKSDKYQGADAGDAEAENQKRKFIESESEDPDVHQEVEVRQVLVYVCRGCGVRSDRCSISRLLITCVNLCVSRIAWSVLPYIVIQDGAESVAFYEASQCVACGKACTAWPELSWPDGILGEMGNPIFKAAFFKARQVAMDPDSGIRTWLPRTVSQDHTQLVDLQESWWFFYMSEWKKSNSGVDPADVNIATVNVFVNGKRELGVLAKPKADEHPWLHKRLTVTNRVRVGLHEPILEADKAFRMEAATEHFNKSRKHELSLLGGDPKYVSFIVRVILLVIIARMQTRADKLFCKLPRSWLRASTRS